ncbi:uncharacterized protein TNCV_4734431 [Trichonephila clavipes]|nr:uncharacterized protein TNCV_4734431 [Trichonephila clavipes]
MDSPKKVTGRLFPILDIKLDREKRGSAKKGPRSKIFIFDYSDLSQTQNILQADIAPSRPASSHSGSSRRSWHDYGRNAELDKVQIPKIQAFNENRYWEGLGEDYAEPSETGGEECFLEKLCFSTAMHILIQLLQFKNCVINSFEKFWIILFCPDLTPSGYHLFPKLDVFLSGKRFGSE